MSKKTPEEAIADKENLGHKRGSKRVKRKGRHSKRGSRR